MSEEVLTELPDALLLLDSAGVITDANHAAERLLGLSRGVLVGRKHDTRDLFEDRGWRFSLSDTEGNAISNGDGNPLDEALASGQAVSGMLLVLEHARSGRTYLRADAVPLHSDLGGLLGVSLVYHDVTEEQARRSESEWLRRDLTANQRQVEALLQFSDALNAINDTIHSTLDFDEVLDRVVSRAAEALDVDVAVIELAEDGRWWPRVVWGLPRETAGGSFSARESAHSAAAMETREIVSVEDVQKDERFAQDYLAAAAARTLVSAPLLSRDGVIGSISFGRSVPLNFRFEEIGFIAKVAATTSLAMENARIYAEERHIADTLQRALLEVPKAVPGLEFHHMYVSATEAAWIGGDFYDVFQLPEDRTGILIGDVSGKGVEASALASFTRQLVKAQAHDALSPASIVDRANDLVFRISRKEEFVTLFFGVLDPDGTLRYCNGGHPPPIVLPASGPAFLLEDGSPMVGAWDDLAFDDESAALEPQDVLVLYTDGIIEASSGEDLFGTERLRSLVETLRGVALSDMPQAIVDEVTRFTAGQLRDDAAILCCRRSR